MRPEVFHCTFDESWDQNYDDWPDGWSRRRGKGYPEYISVKIVPAEDALSAGRCLQIDLDGGAAVAYTPPIRITPLHSYILQGAVDTSGIEFDQASLSLTLLDENNERLETYSSDQVGRLPGWTSLNSGPNQAEERRRSFCRSGAARSAGKTGRPEGSHTIRRDPSDASAEDNPGDAELPSSVYRPRRDDG